MLQLLLLVAAIPVVVLGSIHLGVRILRFVRKNRGAVSEGLSVEGVRSAIAEALEDWVSDTPASSHDAGHAHDHSSGETFEAPHAHGAETSSHSD